MRAGRPEGEGPRGGGEKTVSIILLLLFLILKVARTYMLYRRGPEMSHPRGMILPHPRQSTTHPF